MYRFDPASIVPSHRNLDAQYQFPCAACYATDNGALCFIAARHEYQVGSTTHALIDRQWQELQPQAVVLEGYTRSVEPAWNNDVKNLFVQRALAKRLANPDQQNEARYTLLKAHENNVAIYSGEMSDERQRSLIEQAGFSTMDYDGWMFLTRLSCEANITDLTTSAMPTAWQKLSPNPQRDIIEFYDWHREFLGQDFSPQEIVANQTRPTYVPKTQKWRTLDVLHARLRDQSALQAIENALNTHHRVMVVYGGSHYGCLRPALDAVLGQPVITR